MSNGEDGDGWWAQVGDGDVPIGENRSVSSSSIDRGVGAESDIPLYIGVGIYLVSLLLGTWITSWGFGLSGLEALQTSVDLLLDWPGMYTLTVAFNQEFMGVSFGTSLLLTFNWLNYCVKLFVLRLVFGGCANYYCCYYGIVLF